MKSKKLGGFKFTGYQHVFPNNTQPNGFLIDDPACQALFYYALLARKNWEEQQQNVTYDANNKAVMQLEGEHDPQYNYTQLFVSVSKMYGTTPEEMVRYWNNVDLEFTKHDVPKVPDEDRYRFNRKPKIG